MKKYIIKVAPLIPLPVLRTQVFSYWHDSELAAGTLVSVPFYFREVQGIVVNSQKSLQEQTPLKLKNIKSVAEEKFLSAWQIELAQKIAEYYFTPLGSVLKAFVPTVVKKKKREKTKRLNILATAKRLSPSMKSGSEEIISKILKNRKNNFLLFGSYAQREEINAGLIRGCLKKNKQCLVLVPEVFSAQSVYEKLQKIFSEEIALIHGRITKGRYYDYWQRIKDGKIKIIVASKLGIFLPFADLGIVVVQEEQDASFKQSKAMPRYNAVRGAEFLAELAGAKLILGSSVPSVESYWRAESGELELIELKKDKSDCTKLEIILPEKDKKNSDFPVSKTLYGHLADVLSGCAGSGEAGKNKKQAVVFVNRRGFSTRTICENCKKVLKCPKCEKPLVYSDEAGLYRCLHCSYRRDLLTACPTCGGFQFSHRGVGTQTVEKKLKKLFPAARTARIDADILKSATKYKNILEKFSAGEIDILVGTQAAVKGIYSENIALAAAVSAWDFADGAESDSRHLALARLFHMANLLNKEDIVAIQSFFGGNPIFDIYDKQGLKKYYEQELFVRKRFFYPPFCKFVKVSYRDKSERKVQNETRKMFDLLRKTGHNETEIIGPYSLLSEQKKGLYQRNILIKIAPGTDIRNLPIRSVLGSLRKGWIVDVEPISLF